MRSAKAPSLRTKKGCTRCRAFRKKCDEAKPECARCVRAGTQCTWPRSHELKDARLRKAKTAPSDTSSVRCPAGEDPGGLLTPPASDVGTVDAATDDGTPPLCALLPPTTIASAGDASLFQYFVTVYFAKQLLPKAYGQFRDVPLHVGRLALQDAPMLQIASACAALHMHQTSGAAALHKTALACYGRSMAQLARGLAAREPLSEDALDCIGFTMSFLYIFAASSEDCYHDVSYHVAAAQRYIRARYLDGRRRPLRPADRALLESILYQTFDLTIKGHTSPGPCVDDGFFRSTVQVLQASRPQDDTGHSARPVFDKSPVLGMPLDLYLLVFRIAQLREESMVLLAQGGGRALEARARDLLPEMHRWEACYQEELGGSDCRTDDCTKTDIYNQITLLYVLAASVLLRQVLAASLDMDYSDYSDYSDDIDYRVRAAARLVAAIDKTDPSANCYLGTWALQVLSNACRVGDEARRVFKNELVRRHLVLRSGDIKRALCLLDSGSFESEHVWG